MPDVRLAVGGRGAVEEGELLPSLVLFYRFFEDMVLLPELDDLLLAPDEIERCVYLAIHGLLLYEIA